MRKIWRACRFVLCSLLGLVLLVLLGYNIFVSAARASGHALPELFGWCSAVIISGSMRSAIEVDDVVIARKQPSYAFGDIILFQDDQGVTICHRIVEINENGYLTKGDANNTPDRQLVTDSHVYGKVRMILPRIGVMQRLLHSPPGLAILAVLITAIILWPYFKRGKNTEARG